jgi:hypothetical protein
VQAGRVINHHRALLDLDFGSIMGEGGGVIGSSAMSIKRALNIAGTIKGILGISEFEKAVSGMKSSIKPTAARRRGRFLTCSTGCRTTATCWFLRLPTTCASLKASSLESADFPTFISLICLNPKTAARFSKFTSQNAPSNRKNSTSKNSSKIKDFSGAEIEGAVKDGVLEAFIDGDREAETKTSSRRLTRSRRRR